MRSVMQHQFSQVPQVEIPRSSFNRSHGLKTCFDADYLVPILVDPVYPGDTFNVNTTHFCRLASPTLYPLLDNLFLDIFYFYVPYRILWANFDKFLGAQTDPGDSIDYTIPQNDDVIFVENSLGDYLGLPVNTANAIGCSALPFRAYYAIWNEWFRDQNLQDTITVSTGDANDNWANSTTETGQETRLLHELPAGTAARNRGNSATGDDGPDIRSWYCAYERTAWLYCGTGAGNRLY